MFFIFVKADPTGYARVPRHIYVPHVNEVYVTGGAHDQYADEQLANLQKRIWLIEFLHLGLIIGWQGAMLGLPYFAKASYGTAKNQKHPFGCFFDWISNTFMSS